MTDGPTRQSGLRLAIDTSGPLCAAGLYEGETERGRSVRDIGRGHSETIVSCCTDALAAAGVDWTAIGSVAVNVGPGSFTGIRAGVAAARALGLSLDVPVAGVTAFDAFAALADGPVLVAIDARRGQIYARLPSDSANRGGSMVGSAAEVAAQVNPTGDPLVLVGSGARALLEALPAGAAILASREGAPWLDAQPDIAGTNLAAARGNLVDPEPFYLRAADALPARPSGVLAPRARNAEATL